MPFNGSGLFNRIFRWQSDRDSGIRILAQRVDDETDGIATGLSTCVTKDGQTIPTANLPMGTFRHTNVGDAVANTDYASYGQVLSLAQRRNLLDNGSFQVWQAKPSGVVSITNAQNSYVADKWSTHRDGFVAGMSVSRQTGTPQAGFAQHIRIQRDSGNSSTANMNMIYDMETSDSISYQNKSLKISLWARAGASFSAAGGTLTVQVITGTGTNQTLRSGSGYTGSSTIINQNVVLTTSFQRFIDIPVAIVGSTATQIGVKTFWTPTGTAGANDYIEVVGFQLQNSSVVTDFLPVPFSDDLIRGQRFYFKTFPYETEPVQNFGVFKGDEASYLVVVAGSIPSGVRSRYYLPTPMYMKNGFVTPILYNPVANNDLWRNVTRATNSSAGGIFLPVSASGINNSVSCVELLCSQVAGDFVGDQLSVNFSIISLMG